MSTLALEEFTMLHDGKAMDCAAYCCTTFIVGCLLAYVTVSIKQLGTRIALFSFVAVVQNLTGCREQSVVEADDVGLTAPVGSQTAFPDPETRIISQPGQNLPVSVSPPVNALFDITDDQTSFFLCEAFL